MGDLIPVERGWFGHPAREAPYLQAEHLRVALEEFGATFIKLGQAMSTCPNLTRQFTWHILHSRSGSPPEPFHGSLMATGWSAECLAISSVGSCSAGGVMQYRAT